MDDSNLPLERFRQYLHLLATMQMRDRPKFQVEVSDVVQQAMLRAHEKQKQFHGKSEAEMAGWLRTILANTLIDALRAQDCGKRDPRLVRSIETDLDASSQRIERWLVADQSSPSRNVQKEEQVLRLAEALADLPDPQREAIVLRYFHGMPLEKVAEQLGKTTRAIVGLLTRGTENLRSLLRELQE